MKRVITMDMIGKVTADALPTKTHSAEISQGHGPVAQHGEKWLKAPGG